MKSESALVRRIESMADSVSTHGSVIRMTAAEFAKVYRENAGLVRAVIFQISGFDAASVDDLVQEAFLKIWRSYGDFRHESQLKSWIYRISVNVALDHARRRGRRQEVSEESPEDIAAPREVDHGLVNRDLIAKALLALSEDHQTVLVLSYLHELTVAEVAEVLELSEGTVKSRLHYAKAGFRDFLARKGGGS